MQVRALSLGCVVVVAAACLLAGCRGRSADSAGQVTEVARPAVPAEPGVPIEQVVSERALSLPLSEPRIVIHKADHTLEVYDGAQLVKTYPVGLGKLGAGSTAEAGPKERRGDSKTPEGQYHIRDRHDAGRFYHWMALDYPNADDAERGLRDGLIGEREHTRIVSAIGAGRLPPMDTKLGGDIGIHGGGSGSDWTLGCIAVEDEHADELWALAPVGTPVEILP